MIVCTDHGHYLGEKDIWGKPRGAGLRAARAHSAARRLARRRAAGRASTLSPPTSTCTRRSATLFGVAVAHRTHGRSLAAADPRRGDAVRDWALSGVWGREVHLIDRRPAQVRPRARSVRTRRSSMWSNRWSTMPVHRLPDAADAAARRARHPRPHAGLVGARHPPTLRRRRPAAVLGLGRLQRGSPLRPARGSSRSGTSRRMAARARRRGCAACRAQKPSTRRRSSSNGWGSL